MLANKYYVIGYASGVAGADTRAGSGPSIIKESPYLKDVTQQVAIEWSMIHSPANRSAPIDELVSESCIQLAKQTSELAKQKLPFCVIGGDHTCAIGTWSGVYDALHETGEIGLIWIDAHMDSHTPETSESGRIHGMPLACLLGRGYPSLTSILNAAPKIKPENVCLIGVRSFEQGEAELLARLNVRIYFMDEVKSRGFDVVLKEAIEQVSAKTIGYGLTLDVDAMDPLEVPGVDVPEPDGILIEDLIRGIKAVASDPRLIATEIVEFDPSHDIDNMTEKFIISLMKMMVNEKFKQI